MNTYYITTKEAFLKAAARQLFHPQLHAHYVDLPDGRILISCSFPDNDFDTNYDAWLKMPGVEPLPDPQYENTKKISKAHASALKHFEINENNNVMDIANTVGKINKLMKLQRR